MKILITGICGFVGSALASSLLEQTEGLQLVGIDNLMRPGAEINRVRIRKLGVKFFYGDLRSASDMDALPPCDWVIDAAANPSVLAGVEGGGSRQLFEHNLAALGNVLEYCRRHTAGLLLLSTSRVYSIQALTSIPLVEVNRAFSFKGEGDAINGLSCHGIDVGFPTTPPISLYGATKLASECMALEFGSAFGFPVWITRCGVLAGAGQFGTPAQGIFAYWLNAHLRRKPMSYIGFGGTGHQVRDAMHPQDLCDLLLRQMRASRFGGDRIYTAGGGSDNMMSLAQLTMWCDDRFGAHSIVPDPSPRKFDIPWMVMDNRRALAEFDWRIQVPLNAILEEIATHATKHSDWLEISQV